MVNSKAKGSQGEREIAKILRDHGFDARRGVQYCGYNGDADVIGLPGYHLEVKRVEKLNIDKAYEQSERDAKPHEVPLVVYRKNRTKWKVVIDLEDFLKLITQKEGKV